MPIERDLIKIETSELITLLPVQAGKFEDIQFEHATVHIFCDPKDNGGTLMPSGHVEDLTIEIDDEVINVEPGQSFKITQDEITVFDDKTAAILRHTNVLAKFQRNVSANQT